MRPRRLKMDDMPAWKLIALAVISLCLIFAALYVAVLIMDPLPYDISKGD
jgi:uncharacterized protein YpmS